MNLLFRTYLFGRNLGLNPSYLGCKIDYKNITLETNKATRVSDHAIQPLVGSFEPSKFGVCSGTVTPAFLSPVPSITTASTIKFHNSHQVFEERDVGFEFKFSKNISHGRETTRF